MILLYLANGNKISPNDIPWNNMILNSPIVKMTYLLPNKRLLVFTEFEKYYYLKEKYVAIMGAKGSLIDSINFFGKYRNQVYQFSYHRKGQAGKVINQWGKEYKPLILRPISTKKGESKKFKIEFDSPQKTNHSEWKDGFIGGQPKIEII